jgi:ABC-type nitrate/sulfonate/bicarbonate transport system ATPase subunit
VQNITIGWPEYPIIQENLSFNVMPSQFAVIIGDIGLGKSTLLKAILGQPLVLHGSISANFDYAAYCCQDPWLMNKSVRDNILTSSEYDSVWFSTVVYACSLTGDYRKNVPWGPDIDWKQRNAAKWWAAQTHSMAHLEFSYVPNLIVSKALARAIYSNVGVLILDDVLSGLDPQTTDIIVNKLFLKDGLLRKNNKTVVFATSHSEPSFFLLVPLLTSETGPNFSADVIVELGPSKEHSSYVREDASKKKSDYHPPSDYKLESTLDSGPSSPPSLTPQGECSNNSKPSDLHSYLYYISVTGKKNTFLFIGLCAGAVLGIYVPCRSQLQAIAKRG